MIYKITKIDFDFTLDDDEVSLDEQQQIIQDVLNQQWVADDEDDLVDEITNWTGWCINFIDYEEVEK